MVSPHIAVCPHGRPCHTLSAYSQVGVLVVGAGPTGLGAATRLHQLGYDDFLLIDKVGTCVSQDASFVLGCLLAFRSAY